MKHFILLFTLLAITAQGYAQTEKGSRKLGSGETLKLNENYIRKNTTLDCKASFTQFDTLVFGRGEKLYQSHQVVITSDSVLVHRWLSSDEVIERFAHNLKLQMTLNAKLEYGDGSKATLTLKTKGGSLCREIRWWGGGQTFVTNKGCQDLEVTLTFKAQDLKERVWIIGDSYINWASKMRWPYYLYQRGIKNWMADHIPGGSSPQMLRAFENDLKIAKPKVAIWTLGMNDHSDKDAPDPTWLKCAQRFLQLCKEHGITPILSTIPSVPQRFHRLKAEWVRQSGYRYIDFSAAVTDNDARQWKEGMLYKDNVHPSETGAAALADRLLQDFPEIKNAK